MSTPSLAELRDIHLPPPPFPAAWLEDGWIAGLALIILVTAAGTAWRFLRRRHLRAALRTLSALTAAHAADGDDQRLAAGLSRLLRDYALARFPEAGIAGLTDGDWLAFLDAHGGAGEFSTGGGAALAWLPYRPGGEADAAALIGAVRRWLEANPQ